MSFRYRRSVLCLCYAVCFQETFLILTSIFPDSGICLLYCVHAAAFSCWFCDFPMCLHIAEFPSWWHICDFDIIRLNVGYVVRILQSLFWRVGHHRSVAFVCYVVCSQHICVLKTDSVNWILPGFDCCVRCGLHTAEFIAWRQMKWLRYNWKSILRGCATVFVCYVVCRERICQCMSLLPSVHRATFMSWIEILSNRCLWTGFYRAVVSVCHVVCRRENVFPEAH